VFALSLYVLPTVYFDDTIGITDVYGGPQKDEFRIGQLYNGPRNATHFVQVADPIETTLTTQVSPTRLLLRGSR